MICLLSKLLYSDVFKTGFPSINSVMNRTEQKFYLDINHTVSSLSNMVMVAVLLHCFRNEHVSVTILMFEL